MGWLVVWVVVLLLLKCRTRRPREAEVSCLFRDGSGRNSSMRCGENTPRERGCKKQQLFTLCIKVFTCICTLIQWLCITVQAYITKDTILYINWYIQPLCFHSGIVACEENTEEETERMEPFYRRTRLNTAGLHRITLWETIQSGKNFSFWNLFLHTLKSKLHGPIKRQNV